MKKKIYIFCLTSIIISCLSAQIIHIPTDKSTIQAGIDAANDGDTVLVDQDTYYENINFNGKAITLASKFIETGDTNDINNTIIDGSQPTNPDIGSVITLATNEDTTSIICGFTITGGTGTYFPSYNDRAGGAILCLNSGAKIIHNYIEYNSITSPTIGYGGAIEQYGNNWIILKNNRIRDNENNGNSGAIGGAAEINGSAIIIDNYFSNNTCNSSTGKCGGGALSLSCYDTGWESEIQVSNNTFYENSAYCGEQVCGGAIWLTSDYGIISNNIFKYNQINSGSFGYGSGIMLTGVDTNLLVESNIIENNDYFFGSTIGGGICIYMGKAKLINNVIRDNSSHYGGGLAILDTIVTGSSYPSVLINNTITNNHAIEEGGGLLIETAEAIIFNTIIWGNEALVGTEIYDGSSSLEVQYSDIGGSGIWPGTGNINEDPLFWDGQYHIETLSECKDNGTDEITFQGNTYFAPFTDIDRETRPNELGYDIGADEFYPPPGIYAYETLNNTNLTINIYPNPVKNISQISYKLFQTQFVTMSAFNIHGKMIETLTEEQQVPGEYTVRYDISDLPAGIYIVKIKAGEQSGSGKIIKTQ